MQRKKSLVINKKLCLHYIFYSKIMWFLFRCTHVLLGYVSFVNCFRVVCNALCNLWYAFTICKAYLAHINLGESCTSNNFLYLFTFLIFFEISFPSNTILPYTHIIARYGIAFNRFGYVFETWGICEDLSKIWKNSQLFENIKKVVL